MFWCICQTPAVHLGKGLRGKSTHLGFGFRRHHCPRDRVVTHHYLPQVRHSSGAE